MEGKRHTVFQISRFHISHTRSWHGVIRLIIRVSPFAVPGTSHFLFFSEYLWTIDYRYHIVPALYLVDAHDMSKISINAYSNIYSVYSMLSIFQDLMMLLTIGKRSNQIRFSHYSQQIHWKQNMALTFG